MKLANREIKLVIFDLDGTLLDSTFIWHQIDVDFFTRRGIPMPPDYFHEICHLGLVGAAKYTKEKYGIKETEEEMIKEWQDASANYYLNVLQLKPNVKEFLEYLKKNDVIITLATANNENLYIPCLKRLGIFDYFKYILDVHTVKQGKESPKIYETICEHFGVDRKNTAIFEDIWLGLKTAHDNGFLAVAVDDDASKNTMKEKLENCDLYIYNFGELIK